MPPRPIDPVARRHIWQLIQAARERRMAMVLSSHLMDEFCNSFLLFITVVNPCHAIGAQLDEMVRDAMASPQCQDPLNSATLRWELPRQEGTTWSMLFKRAQALADQFPVQPEEAADGLPQIVDFSLTQNSLEQLFLSEQHALAEEPSKALGHSQAKLERNVQPDYLAMIMYTSGTTGKPKGVLLSHRNIIAPASGQSAVISVSTSDTIIGYLPLTHILEVTLHDRAVKIKRGTTGDCIELKPTLVACVPAVMDKIFKAVLDEVKEKSPIQREIFRICYERKRNRFEGGYKSLVMDRMPFFPSLAFSKISKVLGGNLRFVISGGAPLNPEMQRTRLSTGSVGPPLRSCEIRLREWEEAGYLPTNSPPQGEVLIHGANVALGYFKDDEKTKEEFVELDGKRWFATGDIGQFREDGSLCTLLFFKISAHLLAISLIFRPEEGFDQIVPWRIHRFGTGGDGAADEPERGQHLRLWQPAKGLSGRTCGPKSQKLAEKLSLLASPECRQLVELGGNLCQQRNGQASAEGTPKLCFGQIAPGGNSEESHNLCGAVDCRFGNAYRSTEAEAQEHQEKIRGGNPTAL
ncbi:hypothetical protein niasHT_000368 [Heterodera trifolii]|uniref:long-chain-fatty-acid--CoA ligase n=1 Tax=Heterodera trifolii TaxID=157864 RepID=A0ABD2MC91_9BILA